MVNKEVTEINDILNDQAQVSIKVTKDVKIKGSEYKNVQSNKGLPSNIMHEDKNFM